MEAAFASLTPGVQFDRRRLKRDRAIFQGKALGAVPPCRLMSGGFKVTHVQMARRRPQ